MLMRERNSALSRAGIPVGVSIDIDGNARSTANSPDIGASNVVPFVQQGAAPLCGTYTIGGSSPDYATLDAAVNDLNTDGISCAVLFNVRDGSYNGGQTINAIAGSSLTNTVTFQAEKGTGGNVIIDETNGGLTLNNVKNISFSYLSFSNISSFGLSIAANTNINTILNYCTFSSAVNNGVGVYSTGNCSGLQVIYCTFTSVSNPIALYGNGFLQSDSVVTITDNIMTGALNGILADSLEGIDVYRNQITGSNLAFGIDVSDVPVFDLEKNKIAGTNSIASGVQAGINIYNSQNSGALPGMLINNFISMGGSGGTDSLYGIVLQNSLNSDIYNNSVNITSSNLKNAAYAAFYSVAGVTNEDNVFANTGGGYAIEDDGTGMNNTYDFNDYYSTGSELGNFAGVNIATLASLGTDNGESNSLSVNPQFTSSTDLHVSAVALNNAGTPVGVIDDIDLEPRNSITPDIGADEFNDCRLVASVKTSPSVCPGSDGTATVFTDGGAAPLSYIWQNGQTDMMATNIAPGSDSVIVTDASGCTATAVGVVAASNNWHQMSSIGDTSRNVVFSFSFSLNGKGYYGVWSYSANAWPGSDPTELWEFDPATGNWTGRASFPGDRRMNPVAFSIQNTSNGPKGYVGLGQTSIYASDMWEYTPPDGNGGGDSWRQLNNFQGAGRYVASSFSIGSMGYVAAGYDGNNLNDVWEYNPDNDVWSQKDNWPGLGSCYSASFSIGSKGYMGIGLRIGTSGLVSYNRDFYQFDPTLQSGKQWKKLRNFGGGYRSSTANFSVGNNGYTVLGNSGPPFASHSYFVDTWQYTPLDGNGGGDTWTQLQQYEGQRSTNVGNGLAIGNNGFVYYTDNTIPINEYWKLSTGNQSTPIGGDWSDNCTWTANTPPTTAQLARVSTLVGNTVAVTSNTTAASIAIDPGASVNVNNNSTLAITGDATLQGAIGGDGITSFAGTTTQTISGDGGSVSNLSIDNANGVTLDPTNIIVTGALNLNNGSINTGSGNMVVVNPYTVPVKASSTTGWINGTLEKTGLPTSGDVSLSFEVGDATAYAPVDVDLHGLSGASGSFSAATTAGNYPAIANSPLNPAKCVAMGAGP